MSRKASPDRDFTRREAEIADLVARREAAFRTAQRAAAEPARKGPVSCLETIGVTQHFSPEQKTAEKPADSPEIGRKKRDFEELRIHKSNGRRLELIERLESEGAEDLLPSIRACQTPIWLRCMSCGQRHVVPKKCDQKWCPCCVQHLANIRSAKLFLAVVKFQWPLFITLTMQNTDDVEDVRCATMGVFAPLVGIIGAMQAAEALKMLCGAGTPLVGRLLMLDARSMHWHSVRVIRDPGCHVCGA